MQELPLPQNGTDHNLEQMVAREYYYRLRDKLVSLESAAIPNSAAIDGVIHDLEKARLAYRATHGLFGNNPIDDPRPSMPSNSAGQLRKDGAVRK